MDIEQRRMQFQNAKSVQEAHKILITLGMEILVDEFEIYNKEMLKILPQHLSSPMLMICKSQTHFMTETIVKFKESSNALTNS